MKRVFFHSLYGQIVAVHVILLIVFYLIYQQIATKAAMDFVNETEQKLNIDLAAKLADEIQPMVEYGLSSEGVQNIVRHFMLVNPRLGVHIVDRNGNILACLHKHQPNMTCGKVNVTPIQEFIAAKDHAMPVWGEDPADPTQKRPFSAAPITLENGETGYLYMILLESETEAELVKESYVMHASNMFLMFTILFSGTMSLIVFAFLTRRFRVMTTVVRQFEQGDYQQRMPFESNDDIGRLGRAFNQMADTVVASMEQMRQTDKLRRELIANVSHDLRTPLASIQGYLETVLMKEDDLHPAERRRFLETIYKNITRLTRLVEELFDLSKFDAHQIQPYPEPFSIAELAQDVVLKFQPVAEKRHIDLETERSENLPLVYADIAMIERVLTNLIGNAINYTPPNGTVRIHFENHGQTVRIAVIDSGQGIPEDDLPHIFERFYRVDKSRTRSDQTGTGLGLAIVKKIIEAHESKIEVESRVNVGTTFRFELPVIQP
ncbi:MAG: HAMP domain-containing protein [Gemmatimonadetes bacterium]|nr:MAG: HAMP domain-containing protein [Gemmatimonadota bacterium]